MCYSIDKGGDKNEILEAKFEASNVEAIPNA